MKKLDEVFLKYVGRKPKNKADYARAKILLESDIMQEEINNLKPKP